MIKRILVIDDEDSVREIIQISLELVAGWDTLTAASGSEGIAIAESEHPDVILLDVMMPYMDGPTTFKKLQASVTTCDIPTIMVTAKAQSCEQQQLIDLGVAGVITKPCLPQDLVDEICKILNWDQITHV
ncbi:two-component response regulator [Nostoc sp. NIES-3756]|uniref:response regulator n=1 Tax=Nostoc sp. NIES-3756 TaxID=1751286 RepID=UPI00071EE0F8|nr:response regulator [Nostoc sp. NIES-3756]BAT53831.1 two-component response regulator [Nostoc sp. NIES-3756]